MVRAIAPEETPCRPGEARIDAVVTTYRAAKHGEQVGESLAVLQRKGLPEQQSPAEQQEHVARPGDEPTDC